LSLNWNFVTLDLKLQRFFLITRATSLVWNKLEEQNKDFFKAYHMRLKVKDQIQAFNYLVQEQATILNPRGGMYNYNQNPPFNSPGAQMSPHPQSPRKYRMLICAQGCHGHACTHP
jgi:hypothetical protein